MIIWEIESIELGNFVIRYRVSSRSKGQTVVRTITKTGALDAEFEVFDSYEEAEQTLALLIHDFGGYKIDE